jgi:RecQ family ATP-dependent DNA helicase
MLWTDKAKKILLKYWDFDTLKDKQHSVINEILSGNDVVGLLPTGYGKSLCYLLPPLLTNKTIFIISPLISLMDDQKDKLIKMGIPVSALHSNNSNKNEEINEILKGNIKIVYMSPEYIIDGNGLNIAKQLAETNQLGYLAIDESHCLSGWGHDFRPNYLRLKEFRDTLPDIPIMAVTATAKEQVVKEIITSLKLNSPQIIRANFDRPNLYIECKNVPKIIVKKKEKLMPYDEVIKEYINKYITDRIIVYVTSRKETEKISEALNSHYNYCISSPYHAGLTKINRDKIQTDFIENNCRVIISTIAFGMGIDQVVRCVIILGCPSSIEEYYQQIGRGGRDGLYCETIFFYDGSKKKIKEFMISKENENKILIDAKKENLKKVQNYLYSKKCRRQYILNYLGLSESYFVYNGFTCSNCDNCTKYTLTDITTYVWDYYILKNPLNNKILNVINDRDFNIHKILEDWAIYIKLKDYTLYTLPDNLKIKLRLSDDFIESQYDLVYDKYKDLQV